MNRGLNIRNKALLLALLIILWLFYIFMEFQFVTWIVKDKGYVRMDQGSTMLSAVQIFLLTTVIYPLLEEVIFRLPLRLKVPNVVIALLVATWYYSFKSHLVSTKPDGLLSYKLLISLVVTIFLILLWIKSIYLEKILTILRNRYYLPIIITSASLFAMTHFWKLTYDSLFYALLYILVVYFALGLFLSYVRIKVSFWAALFFHILHNSTPYLVLLYYSIRKGENLFLYI